MLLFHTGVSVSLYVDLKYLGYIRSRLEKFVQKTQTLYNCRCPVCGDSQDNKNKARGYFFARANDLFYKCHNCGISQHFSMFLKTFDLTQYGEYVLEKYTQKVAKPEKEQLSAPPRFDVTAKFSRAFRRLIDLPESNPAVQYCLNRKIPIDQLDQFIYMDDFAKLFELVPQYRDRVEVGAPRLGIPFYNAKKELTGVTLRAIAGESIRYISIKIHADSDEPLIFGLNNINKKELVYVVEGAFDSLFLPNCIACNGSSFNKFESLDIPKDHLILVLDNEPRNREIVKQYRKYITDGFNVCIWPEGLEQKDINEMVLAGVDVIDMVDSHTYSGLEAEIQFTQWSKIT